MSTLEVFEAISGFKVYTEKTKVMKIGGWGDNMVKLCKDLNWKGLKNLLNWAYFIMLMT